MVKIRIYFKKKRKENSSFLIVFFSLFKETVLTVNIILLNLYLNAKVDERTVSMKPSVPAYSRLVYYYIYHTYTVNWKELEGRYKKEPFSLNSWYLSYLLMNYFIFLRKFSHFVIFYCFVRRLCCCRCQIHGLLVFSFFFFFPALSCTTLLYFFLLVDIFFKGFGF